MSNKELNAQNKRIYRAASRLPSEGLAKSFKAIAFRAKLEDSTNEYVVVRDFSLKTIAKLSQGKPFARSPRTLHTDLKVLVSLGLAEVEETRDEHGRIKANRIKLYTGRTVVASTVASVGTEVVPPRSRRGSGGRTDPLSTVASDDELAAQDEWYALQNCIANSG